MKDVFGNLQNKAYSKNIYIEVKNNSENIKSKLIKIQKKSNKL